MSLKASRMDKTWCRLTGVLSVLILTFLIVGLTGWSYILVFVALYIFGVELPVSIESWRSIKQELEEIKKEVKEQLDTESLKD